MGGSKLRSGRLAPSIRGAACGSAYKTAGDVAIYENEKNSVKATFRFSANH
jgi:hypothetical protein